MTTFYVIRHGETEWNVTGRWQGFTDIPLNDTGRTQAARLAARLKAEHARFDALYSSDLVRAWDTARAIADPLGLDIRSLPALREIDLGAWSGLTRPEVIARDGDTLERIASGEDPRRGGNGERLADLHDRVIGAIDRLAAAHPGQTVALVTHGGPVRALLLHAARDKDGPAPRKGHIGNTSISVVRYDRGGWSLGRINDLDHLADTAQAPDLLAPQPPGDEAAAFEAT